MGLGAPADDYDMTDFMEQKDISSLSAFLLNDVFCQFMMLGLRVVDDIGVLRAEHLIRFKMYA